MKPAHGGRQARPTPRGTPVGDGRGGLAARRPVAALALVAGPFAGGREPVITGAILLGFAVGWALLAVLSVRFTDRPQRWAAVPAAAMAHHRRRAHRPRSRRRRADRARAGSGRRCCSRSSSG